MNRKAVVLLSAGVAGYVAAAAMAMSLRGGFLHALIIAAILIYLVGPVAGLATLGYVVGRLWRRRRNGFYWVATVSVAVLEISVLQFASFPAGVLLLEHDVAEARMFCESLVPFLESYKQQHGSYPETVQEVLPRGQRVPRLLRKQDFYQLHQNNFSLEFSVHDGFLPTIHVYYPSTGEWETYT